MALSGDKVSSIRSTLGSKPDALQDIQQNVTSAVSDPFGTVITKVFSKVNGLTSNIEKKIDSLLTDVAKSTDSKGRVTLEGNQLVITITKEDEKQALALKANIEGKVKSIQKTITVLNTTLKSLNSIQTAISTLQTALTIQETILSANPTTGPMFVVFKKAIKIVFLKDMIKQYSTVLKNQLQMNTRTLNSLASKFQGINVSIKIEDEANKGNYIGGLEAEKLLAQDLLNGNTGEELDTVSEDYLSASGKEYILKVEKYGERQLVGRAYEKVSGMIEEQTAASFFATPEQLIEELQTILNLKQ